MEGNESEYFPQYIYPSNRGKQDLFGEWMDSIKRLDAYISNKPIDMEIDGESIDYMDEDPMVLMLREKGIHWEPTAIVEAKIELKNQAWEGAMHPMEDSLEKNKTVQPITPAKNIISIPIESICDHVPIESIPVKSIKNSIPYNMIYDSAYLLALNVFISKISKETFNNEELKQGCVELAK